MHRSAARRDVLTAAVWTFVSRKIIGLITVYHTLNIHYVALVGMKQFQSLNTRVCCTFRSTLPGESILSRVHLTIADLTEKYYFFRLEKSYIPCAQGQGKVNQRCFRYESSSFCTTLLHCLLPMDAFYLWLSVPGWSVERSHDPPPCPVETGRPAVEMKWSPLVVLKNPNQFDFLCCLFDRWTASVP